MGKQKRFLLGLAMYAPFSRLKASLFRRAGAVVGRNVHFAPTVMIRCDEMDKVKIGDGTSFGLNTSIACRYIEIGRDVTIGGDTSIRGEGRVRIGDSAYLGVHTILDCREDITIEPGVQVAPGAKILTHDSSMSVTAGKDVVMKPTKLKERCYIGAGAVILPGITVGEKAVVAAAAVVTKDVPAGTTVAGSPAKPIRKKQK